MAINQAFRGTPGSKQVVGVLESLGEPGGPRAYFDPKAGDFSSATPVQVPLAEDANLPGQFLFQVPSTVTKGWPDKGYLLTVLDHGSAEKDEIIGHAVIYLMGGDDSGLGIPSFTITINGTTAKFYQATAVQPAK